MRSIYLDHNATTPLDPAVLDAMLPFLGSEPGNPSSVHGFGQRARAAVERARLEVAALIGARPAEIVFTSGGTEADNTAIFGSLGGSFGGGSLGGDSFGGAFPPGEPGHIITTAIEHPAVLSACAVLAKRGVEVTCVPASGDGVVNPEDIRRALRPHTRLISVMHANNELGTIQPVSEIGKIAAEAGVLFHCDAVQSAGKLPIDVNPADMKKVSVRLLSLSAHKFGGPKGAGALFVRRGVGLEPLLHGGHSERERRAGTENVAGIVGMGRAAFLAAERLGEDTARIATLRDRLERGLLDRIPGVRVNGAGAPRVANTSNLLFPGVDSEALVIALDLAGLACSAGAACSAGVVDPSHVLTAIGLAPAEARASVRLSLGHSNTEEEIDLALELIPAAVARQRQLSGAGARADREMAARP